MPTRDEEQFEKYLKRFLPIAPEPMQKLRTTYALRPSFRLTACLAAATILVVGTLVLRVRTDRVVAGPKIRAVSPAARQAPLEPLTMRSADAWLATAPSFKAAVDDLAFRPERSPIDQGKQSAVAVLSKEKIRL